MTAVIADQCYSTETASLLAHDASWDGRHWDRDGRNVFLFRTPNGQYFRQVRARWARERDYLEALALEAAIRLYWQLPERALRFEEAFPRVTPLDGVTQHRPRPHRGAAAGRATPQAGAGASRV